MKIKLVAIIVLLLHSCTSIDDSKLFSLLPSSYTGIKFKNLVKETDQFNVLTYGNIYNGGGVAVGDVNNDGLEDLYFTGNMVGSRLYINKGDFKFEDIAKQAGVFAEGRWNTGTTMADVNGDGLLDIYVCRSAAVDNFKRKNLLFINNGNVNGQITFTEKGAEYGIDDDGYSTQGSFFDYDKDGDLDLYVVNLSTQEYASFSQVTKNAKAQRNHLLEDRLYKNENGKFRIVNDEAGLSSNVLSFGLNVSIADVSNDNWPDIYISNDFNEEDYLYLNNQDGTFTESLKGFIGHTSHFSMGTDIADINNDGFPEIMTLDMLPESNQRQKMTAGPDNYDKYLIATRNGFYQQSMRNMLHLNNEGKGFSEIGQLAGVHATDWSWATLIADLDNDGFKDIFVSNGVKKDYTNMDFMNFAVQEKINENSTGEPISINRLLENIPSSAEENYAFKNNGDLTFSKVTEDWGLGGGKTLSSGTAYADLDNDGDLDLIVNNTDQPVFIYRNNSKNTNYLRVKLKGLHQNKFGIGAKINLKCNNNIISQEVMPTRGFQSSVGNTLVFGLGEEKTISELEITWPTGKTQILKDIKANQTLTLNEINASVSPINNRKEESVLFKETNLIDYVHKENNYNDFNQERLLPHMLSTQGPKIAVADVNSDGKEDFYIGGSKGNSGSLFLQNSNSKFIQIALKKDLESEDTGILFFDADNDKDLDLYVVSGGNEFVANDANLQDRLYLNNGKGSFIKAVNGLPKMLESGTCVKAVDIDADGDQDLFVGGGSVPGKYPTAAKSYLLENDGKGNFKNVSPKGFNKLGRVKDAIFTDFNTDGKPDLIIVGEYLPITIFANNSGRLEELKTDLSNSFGWWNTIEPADFDNDGDPDYILGNFGLNSQLKASVEEPVSLFAKDFDSNGSLDAILCSYIEGKSYPVFSRDDILGQLPNLKSKYQNYSDYANQQITDMFTEKELENALELKANNLASSYLENLGNGKFKLKKLPVAAQFSPIQSINILDVNKDGKLDALLAGNFYGTRVKYGRYDANAGLVLLGDGEGNFKEFKQSLGLKGEVRDSKVVSLGSNTQLLIFALNKAKLKTFTLEK